jgi:nitrate/nitrite-specific signal transduction histidine kinase
MGKNGTQRILLWKRFAQIPHRRFPLQIVLVVPFILQIFAAVGLTGYLSLRNGQKAVRDLANQLMTRTGQQVDQHLDHYLGLLPQLAQMNQDAIAAGQVDLDDAIASERYFWRQANAFKNISYIGYVLADGRESGAGRWVNGKELLTYENPVGSIKAVEYTTDAAGNRVDLVKTSDYDPLAIWYSDAVKAGKFSWGGIAVLEHSNINKEELTAVGKSLLSGSAKEYRARHAVSALSTMHDAQGNPIGVLSIDLTLQGIDDFLKNLKVSPAGQVFLLSRDGFLIGSSSQFLVLHQVGSAATTRYSILDSPDPVIRAIGQTLKPEGGIQTIQTSQTRVMQLNQHPYFVQIEPWQDERGIDWFMVVALPESDFMAQINANTRATIFLCLIALVIATLLGILTAYWIARPILKLRQASERLTTAYSQGEVLEPATIASNIDEVEGLARSFNQMAAQIQSSFQQLAESGQKQVAELAKANAEIKQCLDVLAMNPDLTGLIAQILRTIATQLQSPLVEYWTHAPENFVYVEDLYQGDRHYSKADIQRYFPHHPGVIGYCVSDDLFDGESLYRRQHSVLIEDLATSKLLDIGYWHREQAVQKFLSVPLIFGDRSIGAIAVYLRADQSFTPNHLEFVRALTHLATLAIKLTHLAEESRQSAIIQDRNHLAREIHDTLAQGYAGILMQLQAANFLQQQPDQFQIHLDRARSLAREGVADARRSVWLLQQDNEAYRDVSSFITNLVEQMRSALRSTRH